MSDLDARLLASVYGRGDVLVYAMVALSMIGSGWAMIGLVPLLALPKTRAFAAWMTGVLASQSIVVFALKRAFGRTRPYLALHLRPLLDAPTDHSFPSGHAAGSFALAVFLVVSARAAGDHPSRRAFVVGASIVLALACAVALSRVWLGVHWPSDVAAGAAIGSAVGFAGARVRLAAQARATA